MHILDAMLMGDEPTELETCRTLGTDILGKSHSARDGSVYEYGKGLLVGIGNIEEYLGEDTQGPHQQGCQQECRKGIQDRKGRQFRYSKPFEQKGASDGEAHGNQVRIGQLEQVDETGITQDTRICTENAGSDPTQKGIERRS